jgi:phosphate transport system permease protein
LALVELNSGEKYLGEVWSHDEKYIYDEKQEKIIREVQLKIGNRDLSGQDFIWLAEADIAEMSEPGPAITIERWEYGNFYGFISGVSTAGSVISGDQNDLYDSAMVALGKSEVLKEEIHEIEQEVMILTEPLGEIQYQMNILYNEDPVDQNKLDLLSAQAQRIEQEISVEYTQIGDILTQKNQLLDNLNLVMNTGAGQTVNIPLAKVVRLYQPNNMSIIEKTWFYTEKLIEFVSDDPRESNTEGGVFPAIFGTVMMVLLMSIAVVPLGVMAAIYLNEYARQGPLTRLIRLSVNNLAGVPSIVFGIFGLGFFIYIVGGGIDQFFFSNKLPEPTFGTGGILWASLTLALLTLPVVVVATEESILAVPRANKEGALALGATKWQMIRKIVLPGALPGILTGLILAISRGAGEVAPLMITGVVKLAPSLAVDGTFPFLHLDRKFMHLGFHIYDVGFQSPNIEAALPMVYSTALLLLLIVILLNVLAIYTRNKVRKKLKTTAF